MKGNNTQESLERGLEKERKIMEYLNTNFGFKLTKHQIEHQADLTDGKETYEVKEDPFIGTSENVMFELFASILPGEEEKGWGYRYKNTDNLIFYCDDFIYCYDCKKFINHFWDKISISHGNRFVAHIGVKENRYVLLLLFKKEEMYKYLKWIVNRKENKLCQKE